MFNRIYSRFIQHTDQQKHAHEVGLKHDAFECDVDTTESLTVWGFVLEAAQALK